MTDRCLTRDQRGVTAIEFALLVPVLLLALLGMMDLGYNMYTASLLEGAIQAAARESTLEGANRKLGTIDERVTKAIRDIAPNAETPTFVRTAYPSFSSAGKPEDYTDTNKNGACDRGEPFEDVNENGTWDADQGRTGLGGARDVVVYEVTVTYPRPFPVASLLGMGSTFTTRARTVLSNQPWDNVAKTPPVKNCK
jgi:Flp pilus assembly pilin Flp